MSRDNTPISFKTVPGRNKTQKWTKAPAVDYGGDEWGGYDEYDDYEEDRNPALPPPPPSSIPASQAPPDPYAPSSGLARKNSFDRGDETRAFSSSTHPVNNTQNDDHHTPGRSPARDFTNPEQVPAPLSMHNSPIPAQGERWPGRKESMSSKDTPPTTAEKPLPFIRPSDIYKRIPDEIRRQSEEGTRPSMDSIGSGARERVGLGLEPVAEDRESRLFLDGADTHSTALRGKSTSPRLPDVTRFSGFGDDFLSGSTIGSEKSPASTHSPEAVIARVANAPFTASTTSSSSIQHTPITRSPPDQDPAADILSERQNDNSVDTIAGGQPASLQHQPSAGFRSAVHTAFDRNDSSISRDNSQASDDVQRNDTSPTAGISPIISRGPQFPSIAEETSSTTGQSLRGNSPESRVSRKPSPGGTGGADFVPGYRRSLDPPSTGTSPARTPGLESVETRRLSTPMSAVPMDAETPDVPDQAAEMPTAILHAIETPSSELGVHPHLDASSSTTAPIPITGRGRSNTDYSIREADIAQTVNSTSPEQEHEVSGLIDAQRDSQKIFLETHVEKQPASPISPGGEFREGASGSRAGSPTKGRVREIADKYHGMNEAARRNSAISVSSSSKALSTKSSWSNFDDTEKKLARKGAGESEMYPAYENADLSTGRPGVTREESFKPDLPGGWISSAPTPEPGAGPTSPFTPQQAKATPADEEELTPTTRKNRLQEPLTHQPPYATTTKSPNALDQAKNAGSELGAALMASVGVSHQTRDFGSAEPAAPVNEREVERPTRGMQPPTLFRHETDSDAPLSVASTMPPSPPAKDSPKIGETLGSGYFSTVAPLRVKSREESPVPERSATQERGSSLPRPGMTTALSMEPGAEDEESDRLRKEIVRSLDPINPVEGEQLTQDALDAPDNQRRVASGQSALPPAESRQPALLQTRFSWENPHPSSEQAEPLSPEIKPEMSYERPRSKALHVVNPNEIDSPGAETPVARAALAETLKSDTFGTPITEKHEQGLLPDTDLQPGSPSQSLKEIPPSPTSERKSSSNVNRQSYYASDSSQAPAQPPTSGTTILPGQNGLATSPVSSAKASGPSKPIPPFRNILALKTGDERIKTYNETRTTFANMNTGLGDWVGGMLALHPELANNSTTGAWKAPPLQTTGSGIAGTFLKGHKASPSLAKFTNKFGDSGQRSTSVGSVADEQPSPNAAVGGGAFSIRPTTSNTTAGAGPSSSTTGLPAFDTDKMQQKGKAFIAKTGVFGGKAQAGAKGLFAKGKSRFASGGSGNEKVFGFATSTSAPHSGPAPPPSSAALSSGAANPLRGIEDARGSGPAWSSVSAAVAVDDEVRDGGYISKAFPTTSLVAGKVPNSTIPLDADAVVLLIPNAGSSSSPVAVTGMSSIDGSGREPQAMTATATTTAPAAASKEESGGVRSSSPVGDIEGAGGVYSVPAGPASKGSVSEAIITGTGEEPLDEMEKNRDSESLTKGVEEHDMETGISKVHDVSLRQGPAEPIPLPSRGEERIVEQHNDNSTSLTQISTTPELSAAPIMDSASLIRPSTAHATTSDSTPTNILPETTSTTPISAIRPAFSRRTSSKSASPFRSPSPQTSDRKSRPRSMIWTDWLRDKTQSISRKSSGNSRSRPASMMILPTTKDPSTTEDTNLADLSDVAVYTTSPDTTAPIDIPLRRTETWNSPDAVLPPPRTPETGEVVLGRLGVLPSPALTGVGFESPGSRKRRRSSAAATTAATGGIISSFGGPGEGLGFEVVPKRESEGSPTAAGRRSPVGQPLGLRKVSEVEEVGGGKPGSKTSVSELQGLPSERKRLSLGMGMPRPDSLILKQSQVDLLAGRGRAVEDEGVGDEDGTRGGVEELRLDRSFADRINGDAVLGAVDPDAPQGMLGRSRSATGLSPGKATAHKWDDARSEVSAEEGGAVDEVLPHASTNPGTSRHSSVSSLGAPNTFSASQGAGNYSVESSQAEAVSEALLLPAAATVGDGPAISQQMSQRPGMTDRALSYMPLPRDDDGLPIPETITTGSLQQLDSPQQADTAASPPLEHTMTTASLQQTNTLSSNEISPVSVDLGAMSGPPPTTPPFQEHPVFSSSGLQPEISNNVQIPATEPVQGSTSVLATANTTSAERQSGYLSNSQTGQAAIPFVGAPPPNRITDDHGLEDLQHSDDEAVSDIRPRAKDQQPTDKQNKRRSGLWDVLTTKRASSGAKLDYARDGPAGPPEPNEKPREENAKRKLQKPQRASTSAVAMEPKKKRFSSLGSIFGRSETTRQSALPKVNKLTKMAPASTENIRGMESPKQSRPGDASTVSGNVASYEEYEARRKREAAAWKQTPGSTRPVVASNQTQDRKMRMANPDSTQPPPAGGWYGPADAQRPLQQPTLPNIDPRPEYRRLHSQGRGHARPSPQIPQAFRPVEASFNAPVPPVGPPPDPRIVQEPSRESTVYSSNNSRRFSFERRNSYGSAYASEFSGFSGPQVAASQIQLQQSAPSQSSSGPDVSPILTRSGPPMTTGTTIQAQRVLSRGTETARSPANDYPDQQTPWAITIPPGQATTRHSSWDVPRDEGATVYSGPRLEAAPYSQQQQQQYPSQSGYNGPYFPPSDDRRYATPSGNYMYDNGMQASRGYHQQSYGYGSRPQQQQQQQQQQYSYPQHPQQQQQLQHSYQPQQPRSQNRYYSQQQQQQQNAPQPIYQQNSVPPPQQQNNFTTQQQQQQPHHHHRRKSSGYSGRRDDMTAGEEELVMRGVSYPGQEWCPPGLGRNGWD